ncbi:hypothetical protein [Planomicrobium okeanokoites]|uniref:Uncharacterized protein n=1 Tax=Planomicrobium okeanokoites TaxID=244 RepID=A0ABV7KN92_PLAOK|nr:hypothetical protein [Planomicrobium okeanokoites]TAA66066.1 hypothetical protein D2910_15575 [Planomicrobium okeanokoites]
MEHTQEELTARLKDNVMYSKKGSLNIINKEIPFEEESRGLDPRVRNFLANEVDPNARRPLTIDDLEVTRSKTEVNNKDLSRGIHSETAKFVYADHEVPLGIYNQTEEKKPVLIYLHGADFLSGM